MFFFKSFNKKFITPRLSPTLIVIVDKDQDKLIKDNECLNVNLGLKHFGLV